MREANSLLQLAQFQVLTQPTAANMLEEKRLQERWEFLRTIEESYFRQCSRINWLSEGDHNTTFFHRLSQVRNAMNSICCFTLASGETISDPVLMSTLAVGHFQHLFSALVQYATPTTPSWIQSLTSICCSPELSSKMISPPQAPEIEKTIFKLNPNKSPGPDGLTSGFYKAVWSILGSESLESNHSSSPASYHTPQMPPF